VGAHAHAHARATPIRTRAALPSASSPAATFLRSPPPPPPSPRSVGDFLSSHVIVEDERGDTSSATNPVLLHKMRKSQAAAARGAKGGLARLDAHRPRSRSVADPHETPAEATLKLEKWLKQSQGVESHSKLAGGLRAGREGGRRLMADMGRYTLEDAVEKDMSTAVRQARHVARPRASLPAYSRNEEL
jgi:hypothetical protein